MLLSTGGQTGSNLRDVQSKQEFPEFVDSHYSASGTETRPAKSDNIPASSPVVRYQDPYAGNGS